MPLWVVCILTVFAALLVPRMAYMSSELIRRVENFAQACLCVNGWVGNGIIFKSRTSRTGVNGVLETLNRGLPMCF